MVTGLGVVSGLGWGVAPFQAALRAGRTGLGAFTRFDHSGHRTHIAAQVPDPPPALAARYPRWRRLSLADRFALAAADEALAQPGLLPLSERADPSRVGVFFGSSTGGMWEGELFFADLLAGRARLALLASQPVSGPGDAVARHLGVTGPVETLSSACSSASLALGTALDALRAGEVDIAVAGGADSLCQLTYAGFNALRAVSEIPCRPFRAGREGLSIGEGAAVLLLEPLDRAVARGAVPLAELAGAGASCDAHHMTAPDPSGQGAAAAVAAALADAGMESGEIDFLNAHGTGTPLNDAAEWRAFERIFGERLKDLPLAATKANVGHLLGSAGAIEAVATVLCLTAGEVHPTPGAGAVDPDLPVQLVQGTPLALAARAAVSTNLAFGGSNAALVFSHAPVGQATTAGRDS
ncbi:MAG TPA: beta-ketoacyl-[acyl-carrier-protein] synthase family protein [Thermoanaerobaculia bacterium]|nr:beta-ketoacyl-[acyl-carrier-protein] synthase family protein [Thermoanaerobaculia bacterium]